MSLTLEQVQQMAPDEPSLAAGKKLQAAKHWQNLGCDEYVLWGECLGSGTYQVKFDLAQQGYHCSCPSRKFPCKHVLGLLLLSASSPALLAKQSCPEWVAQWLAKRQESAARKQARLENEEKKPVDEKAQLKRAQQRRERVADGLIGFDLWLKDLVRNGLAGLEAQGGGVWEEQSRRLVDAQASGLASTVRRLGELPGSSPDWPARLLSELGKIKLAIHAYKHIDRLDPALAEDLRQWIGWTVTSDEVEKTGEKIADEWLFLGQWIDDDDRLRMQRTWCLGQTTGRLALVLQFAAGSSGFATQVTPGTKQHGVMSYYQGTGKQRAQFSSGEVSQTLIEKPIAGHGTIESFLHAVACDLARQPWLTGFGCVLSDVTLARFQDRWWVRDTQGQGLPLIEFDAWRILALSGGMPFSLSAEWNGHQLRPLGAFLDDAYRLI